MKLKQRKKNLLSGSFILGNRKPNVGFQMLIYNVGRRRVKNYHFLDLSINGSYEMNMDRIKTFCEQTGT